MQSAKFDKKSFAKGKVVVIEDNSNTRVLIRETLRDVGLNEVSTFDNGNPILEAKEVVDADYLIIDYDLAPNANGVDVVNELVFRAHLKPSTAVIFVTGTPADVKRSLHLDYNMFDVVEKPFSKNTFSSLMKRYFERRQLMSRAYKCLDLKNYPMALASLLQVKAKPEASKLGSYLDKTLAFLLLKTHFYDKAEAIYDAYAKKGVMWGKWGKIHTLYLKNELDSCHKILLAFESSKDLRLRSIVWQINILIKKSLFEEAMVCMEKLSDYHLSLPEVRLKAYAYVLLDDQQQILNYKKKKIESAVESRSLKLEMVLGQARGALIRAHLSEDEEQKFALVDEAESQLELITKKNERAKYGWEIQLCQALIAFLRGNSDEANALMTSAEMAIEEPNAGHIGNMPIVTLSNLAYTWFMMEEPGKAADVHLKIDAALDSLPLGTKRTISGFIYKLVFSMLYDKVASAKLYNQFGLKQYELKNYNLAAKMFVRALARVPKAKIFKLNLLKTLIISKTPTFRGHSIDSLKQELKQGKLNEKELALFKQLLSMEKKLMTS